MKHPEDHNQQVEEMGCHSDFTKNKASLQIWQKVQAEKQEIYSNVKGAAEIFAKTYTQSLQPMW